MTRSYHIAGECRVLVRFGAHIPRTAFAASGTLPVGGSSDLGWVFDLGLAEEHITITPTTQHDDIHVADFGPKIPADIESMLSECTVRMRLIHYDLPVLDTCVGESWGGVRVFNGVPDPAGFRLLGAGTFLGNNLLVGSSGCHFVSLNIQTAQQTGFPYRFAAAFLSNPPYDYPIGTKRSLPELTWRCIPYNPTTGTTVVFSGGSNSSGGGSIITNQGAGTAFSITTAGEIQSSGATLLDHVLDF